jgi:putative endonuclease
MWYVYLLRCSDGSLYCGITNDVKRRLKAHQSGKGAKYTRSRLPVKLAYTEPVGNKSKALKREYEIKKLSKSKKEEMIIMPVVV